MTQGTQQISTQDAQRIGRALGERVHQELEQRFRTSSATGQEVVEAVRTLDWQRFLTESYSGSSSGSSMPQSERSESRA